ncbi:hypothetical protein [Herbaspirillum sp. RV1423]|uniref:T6SS immunity protein Tli3 family protein n=1 Tax=Herbaspirillum sp. RV1423 TaxID=1443993 RepID=UPI0012DBFBD4|nr:hypothetical protein [Herbaspirillum sp. RV1423]
MNAIKTSAAIMFAISVAGCAGNTISEQNIQTGAIPQWDVPTQVIYRIDENRYISMENYDRCYGDSYYVDETAGIRTRLWRGNLSRYLGRLIIADPTGMNIVVPDAPAESCGDRGCNVYLSYSTDGGRTFKDMKYMQSSYPTKASENYSILVAKDGFYVAEKRSQTTDSTYVIKYPLVPNIDLDNPYPEGVKGEGFALSKKSLPPLRTPSGQDRFTCDASIRPSNLPKEK